MSMDPDGVKAISRGRKTRRVQGGNTRMVQDILNTNLSYGGTIVYDRHCIVEINREKALFVYFFFGGI